MASVVAVIKVLESPKLWYALLGVYLAMYVTILSPYVAVPGESSTAVQLLRALQWLIPLLLLVFLIPGVAKAARRLFNVKFWTTVGLAAAVACTALELLRLPGLWWSWSTLGLAAVVFTVVVNLTALAPTERFLLSTVVVLAGLAGFELLYQTGLVFYWNFFGSGLANYTVVVAENLMWLIPSLIVIFVLQQRHGIVHLSAVTVVHLTIFAACTAVWFANGMDIPLRWWQGVGPFDAYPRELMIAVSRGSQGFLCAGIASLFINGGTRS